MPIAFGSHLTIRAPRAAQRSKLRARVGAVRVDGDDGLEDVRVLFGEREDVFVWDVELGLLKVRGSVREDNFCRRRVCGVGRGVPRGARGP